jgi:small GTP-binding protein
MVRGVFRFRGRGKDGGTSALLTEQQHELLREEQALLDRLTEALNDYPGTEEDREAVRSALEQLTSLFLLVIVGEFNSGKSALINALIGEQVMPEGAIPTTAVINLLRFGETKTETMLPNGIIERTYPADFLEEITIVDTPGTNAIIREHEELTQRFVPRSDLVLFITSADRPFSESEREFMAEIREWGKKIVLIVNKIDQVRTEEDRRKILDFVEENILRLLGFKPEIFPLSALLAQQAKSIAERNPQERDRLWRDSQFEPLERYVIETLDEEGRIRLKILNPLGIAERLSDKYLTDADERLNVLRDDLAAIENIERQLQVYQDDMRQQFREYRTRAENIILKMIARGDAFFEETIRLGRVFDLIKPEKVKAMFEREVVSDTEARIDATVEELIDWMVERDLRIWQDVTEYIDRQRLRKYEDELIGEVSGQFRYDRRSLLEAVASRAREEVERYDADREADELALSVRNAVATVAVAEAGAVGLGALVVAAASTVAFDVTGIAAAGLVAGLGLFVLPRKRKTVRNEFREKAGQLEERLVEAMNDQFEVELKRSVQRIRDAIAPYTRFVRTEQERLQGLQEQLNALRNDLRNLRHRVGPDPDVVSPPPIVAGAGSSAPWLPAGAVPQPLPAGTGRDGDTPAGSNGQPARDGAGRPARADDV